MNRRELLKTGGIVSTGLIASLSVEADEINRSKYSDSKDKYIENNEIKYQDLEGIKNYLAEEKPKITKIISNKIDGNNQNHNQKTVTESDLLQNKNINGVREKHEDGKINVRLVPASDSFEPLIEVPISINKGQGNIKNNSNLYIFLQPESDKGYVVYGKNDKTVELIDPDFDDDWVIFKNNKSRSQLHTQDDVGIIKYGYVVDNLCWLHEVYCRNHCYWGRKVCGPWSFCDHEVSCSCICEPFCGPEPGWSPNC